MGVRIDKWLWAVRVYKTRTDATDACRNNRVTVNGATVKPSREVKEGDTVTVRKNVMTYTVKVLQAIGNRQPARNVPLYAENLTPQEEYDRVQTSRFATFAQRDRGAGRPTKKERREIDDMMDDLLFYESDDNE